jgi:carboxylesterase type B
VDMSTVSLDHESLGRIRGIVSEDGDIVQYRGIKFADIPGRWQDPVLLKGSLTKDGGEFNATRHGPSCPQHPSGFAYDLSLVGNMNLELEETEQSELDCLNLTVTVPVGLKTTENLPVFAWYVSFQI